MFAPLSRLRERGRGRGQALAILTRVTSLKLRPSPQPSPASGRGSTQAVLHAIAGLSPGHSANTRAKSNTLAPASTLPTQCES
ncbi:protein of unknown function [Cupriavidus taiwanensis]|nr:protein of unknown function [Cupriavidus taiwanensis]